jgi:isocitrate dehydrogenase (NAD+)
MAVRLGRKKVTVVHKGNILPIASGLFLRTALEVAKEYEGRLEVNSMIVDATAERLVTMPEIFDVIVTTNLFGDILSDLIAGLVGGLGLIPGGNIGTKGAIFEAVHGTAPDIAGQNKANPTALMLAAASLLDHVGEHDKAAQMRNAIFKTLQSGKRTGDLRKAPGTIEILSTSDYAKAVIANLG